MQTSPCEAFSWDPECSDANSALSMHKGIHVLEKSKMTSDQIKFYKSMLHPNNSSRTEGKEIEQNIYALGAVEKRALDADEFVALSNKLTRAPTSFVLKRFLRCRINNKTYHSKFYKHSYARNSYTVIINDGGKRKFMQVQYYFQHDEPCFCSSKSQCSCQIQNFAMGQELLPCYTTSSQLGSYGFNAHVLPVTKEQLVVFDIASIEKQCMFLEQKDPTDFNYIVFFPNYIETD